MIADVELSIGMNIIHLTGSLCVRTGGGMAAFIQGLARQERRFGNAIFVGTLSDEQVTASAALDGVPICAGKTFGPRALGYSPELKRQLAHSFDSYDVIHCHGLWEACLWNAAKAAHTANSPYVISSHGMMEPWSLQQSRIKKQIARRLFVERYLKQASCLHATAEQEARNVRKLGFRNPIAVIPIGLDVSTYYISTRKDEIENKWKSLKGKRLLLFISRMHPKKGLLNLAKAWGDLFRNYPDWHLVIAGPDSGGHARQVRSAITAIGAENATTFTGPVYGDVKRKLYASCDIFVLPTFSENFGIVIAEALASGKPVITTKGTPWSELEKHDCGWYIDIGVGPLREALGQAMSSSDSKRAEMGKRGRALIKEKYSWPKIAGQMIDVYRWLLVKGNKPDCVRID